jgi:TrmH family RNA methyltransferase
MIKTITSLQNQFIKDLVSLKTSNKKKKENRFLIEGEDLVSMAYETNQLDLVISLEEQLNYSDVDQIIVNQSILDKLSNNKSTSKILGVAHYQKYQDLGKKVIFLDNVQDPGNVGTIIRTALSFSYDSVVLGNNSASLYNEKVIQSSKGAVFKLPVYEQVNLKELKEDGYKIVSSLMSFNFPTKIMNLIQGAITDLKRYYV